MKQIPHFIFTTGLVFTLLYLIGSFTNTLLNLAELHELTGYFIIAMGGTVAISAGIIAASVEEKKMGK